MTKILDYLCVFCVCCHVIYGYVSKVINDTIYRDTLKANQKMKYLWQKKFRLGMLLAEYTESDDYMKDAQTLDRLIYGSDIHSHAT